MTLRTESIEMSVDRVPLKDYYLACCVRCAEQLNSPAAVETATMHFLPLPTFYELINLALAVFLTEHSLYHRYVQNR
jgi:hypothetical protein